MPRHSDLLLSQSSDTPRAALDVVIPMVRYSPISRIVVEGVAALHQPRRILIIAPLVETHRMRPLVAQWKVSIPVQLIAEEHFFSHLNPQLNISLEELRAIYENRKAGEDHREFGWWLQQLLKLGSAVYICDISDEYIVWDGDLIPLEKWDLQQSDCILAVLQASHKSPWLCQEYKSSLFRLVGIEAAYPKEGGTFIAHHMRFRKSLVLELLHEMEERDPHHHACWAKTIMAQCRYGYRFSEYLTYTSFLAARYPEQLIYYPQQKFARGQRCRRSDGPSDLANLFVDGNQLYREFRDKLFAQYPEYQEMSYLQLDYMNELSCSSSNIAASAPLLKQTISDSSHATITDKSLVATKVTMSGQRPVGEVPQLYMVAIIATVWVEIAVRFSRCDGQGPVPQLLVIGVNWVFTILAIFSGLKNNVNVVEALRPFIRILHALDGPIALCLGFSMAYQYSMGSSLAIMLLNKFGLLHFITRMITADQSASQVQLVLYTSKAFMHHLGSFMFATNPQELLITGVWRCCSMLSHITKIGVDVFESKLQVQVVNLCNLLRMLSMQMVIFLLILRPDLRQSFGASAVGHVAYLLVRAEALFRTGGADHSYLMPDKKKVWLKSEGLARLNLLFRPGYEFLFLELIVEMALSFVLLVLRVWSEIHNPAALCS